MKKICEFFVISIFLFLFSYRCFSEEVLTTREKVDWKNGIVEVEAEGTSPANKTINQADAAKIALTTARHLAYEKLGEIVGGIQITSNYTYKDIWLENSKVEEKVKAVLKGAKVVKEKVDTLEDGSVIATVNLRMKLTGNSGLASKTFSIPEIKKKIEEEVKKEEKTEGNSALKGKSVSEKTKKEKFTGLIVDCRGLVGFKPSLTVGIVDKNNKTIYGPGVVYGDILLKGKMVTYVSTLEEAKEMKKVIGKNPLVVEAEKIIKEKPNTVVISEKGSEKVKVIQEILKKGKVVFII